MVFKTGVEDLTPDSNVTIRSSDNHLLGIGTVRAVLARGRTLNITPSMVLNTATTAPSGPKNTAGSLP